MFPYYYKLIDVNISVPEVADEIRMLASDPEAYKLKMEEKRRVKDNRGRQRFVLLCSKNGEGYQKLSKIA